MDQVELVGKFGVAELELCGGWMDGQRYVALVGVPFLVRMKKAKPTEQGGHRFSYISMWYSGTQADEGEDWKKEAEAKAAQGAKPERFALYLPRILNGKATGHADFAGEVTLSRKPA